MVNVKFKICFIMLYIAVFYILKMISTQQFIIIIAILPAGVLRYVLSRDAQVNFGQRLLFWVHHLYSNFLGLLKLYITVLGRRYESK